MIEVNVPCLIVAVVTLVLAIVESHVPPPAPGPTLADIQARIDKRIEESRRLLEEGKTTVWRFRVGETCRNPRLCVCSKWENQTVFLKGEKPLGYPFLRPPLHEGCTCYLVPDSVEAYAPDDAYIEFADGTRARFPLDDDDTEVDNAPGD
jgi:hypothetical protein